jgi:hypothetical protein
MSTTTSTKPLIQGPGLKAPGIVVMQFFFIALFTLIVLVFRSGVGIITGIAIIYLVLFYEQISVIIVLLIFNFELVALMKTNLFFFDVSVHKSWLIASLHFMFFFLSILV